MKKNTKETSGWNNKGRNLKKESSMEEVLANKISNRQESLHPMQRWNHTKNKTSKNEILVTVRGNHEQTVCLKL